MSNMAEGRALNLLYQNVASTGENGCLRSFLASASLYSLYSLLNITLNIYNKFHCPQIAEANRGGQLCTII